MRAIARRPGPRPATYLYCLVRGRRPPNLRAAPPGLPGTGPLRAIALDRTHHLIATDAPIARYGAAEIARSLGDLKWVSSCAVAHEAVVEHFARSSAVAPMKLFTLFASDERARTRLARMSARIARILDRVDGCQEWGVRVAFDEGTALALAVASRPRRAAGGTGFLVAKRDAQRARVVAHDQARGEIERAFAELARLATASRRNPPAQNDLRRRVVLDAVFLVPIASRTGFRRAVRRIAERLPRAIYPVTLHGPWPPYSFLR